MSSDIDAPRPGQSGVQHVEIDAASHGQRLDNFLMKQLKGVPKALIYRISRKGEVRVNSRRAKPMQKLQTGDVVRIPPVRFESREEGAMPGKGLQKLLSDAVIFEDDYLLAINKPSGLAVHGGSGLKLGVIESLRAMGVGGKYLELAHRLDRETSGCLLLAKKRATLVELHKMLRDGEAEKTYQALVVGKWSRRVKTIDAPLKKNSVSSGERMVRVEEAGKESITHFAIAREFQKATLLNVKLDTGRTHQIRVHAQLAGHPVMGDEKYSSKEDLALAKMLGFKRMFLHAQKLSIRHPESGQLLELHSPLPDDLETVLKKLN
ncbi:MAG: RluA family pseudouridine synthase [Pseudomonadales bacterium]